MPIAIFANKIFQVSSSKLYTLDDFNTGTKLQTEDQDVAGKKPSTYIKNVALETLNFNIPLNAALNHNIIQEYEEWKAIHDSQKPSTFILGNRPLSQNKWLLISVDLSNTKINSDGIILTGVLKLQFKEYARAGSAKASSSSSNSINLGNYTFSDKEIAHYDNLLFSFDKDTNKRSNPNAIASIHSGIYQELA